MSSLLLLPISSFPKAISFSPIKIDNLTLQLCAHPDRQKVDYVLNGIHSGFRLGFHHDSCKLTASTNCPSAQQHPSVIDDFLKKEVTLGCVFGPTNSPPIFNFHISRFGVIPKKGGLGLRLILDLSYPFGQSVNDGIKKDEFALTYSRVKDAIDLILKTFENITLRRYGSPFSASTHI